MITTVRKRKRGKVFEVTDRYAEYLIKNKLASDADKKEEKEEKAKPETKEEKAKVITKAVK